MSRFNNIQQSNALEKIIEDLENETYMTQSFANNFKEEVVSRIEEFSSWFNSIARLYIYKSDYEESEILRYLLKNLKKSLDHAIVEANEASAKSSKCYTCICNEQIQIQPYQNVWKGLQNHLHFEENFNYTTANKCTMKSEHSLTANIVEPLSRLSIVEPIVSQPYQNGDLSLNSFRFNFVIKYDEMVYEYFYPSSLVQAARVIDNLREFSVQICGPNRGSCLLCCCPLVARGGRLRTPKVTSFIVKNHATGQKHISNASSSSHTEALQNYHSFWKGQEACYQAHQIYFVPEHPHTEMCRCNLCGVVYVYDVIIDHIKDADHKKAVLEIFNAPGGKLQEFHLLDLQLQAYNISIDNGDVNDGSSKRKANGAEKASCNIVKCVIDSEALSLPPRFSDHLRFLQRRQSIVHCKACNKDMIDNFFCIRKHIVSPIHKEKSKIHYQKFNYFCDFCSISLKDERSWLDHFQKGPNKHNERVQDRLDTAAEYECKSCTLVIFGDEASIKTHMTPRFGKGGRIKDIRLSTAVKIFLRSRETLIDEAQRMQHEAITVLQQRQRTFDCCKSFEKALSKMYINCRAYPFGSRISGLANQQSDLDVFIDIGGMYRGDKFQEPVCQEEFVKNATKVFKSFKEFSNVFPIPSARTPITWFGRGEYKFPSTLYSIPAHYTTFYFIVEKWSLCCILNEHITNYSLAIMAVFYLQVKGHLPSVSMIRKYNPSKSVIIDGWETLSYPVSNFQQIQNFFTPISRDICQLLQDFFAYFSEFDYANEVVCPLLGKTVPKFNFNEEPGHNLPPEMQLYVKRLQNPNAKPFRGLSPFCVQDPFDLSHNLTKACQPHVITKLKTYCKLSYELLKTFK